MNEESVGKMAKTRNRNKWNNGKRNAPPFEQARHSEQPLESGWSNRVGLWIICIVAALAVSIGITRYVVPGPINAVSYSLGAPFNITPSDALKNAEVLFEHELHGPECIAIHPKTGVLYTGLKTGQIVGIDMQKKIMDPPIKLTDFPLCTGMYEYMGDCGRALGMRFHKNGELYYVDAYIGLHRINLEKNYKVMLFNSSTEVVEDRTITYLNDFDFLPDGRIVMSESSYKFKDRDYLLDILEHRPNGRILIYDPATSVISELARDLYFPNGVQVWNGDIYVAELGLSRIVRMDPSTGNYDVFLDRIPGYPDNIRLMNDGNTLLVPIPARRYHSDDYMFEAAKGRELLTKIFVKGLLEFIVGSLSDSRALLLKVDMRTGEVIEALEDPTGRITDVTVAVDDADGNLFIGSDNQRYLARYAYVMD